MGARLRAGIVTITGPVRIEAQTELIATRRDVWALLAEPQHLADWWPAYATIRPDRRGLAEGARWQVVRGGYDRACSGGRAARACS